MVDEPMLNEPDYDSGEDDEIEKIIETGSEIKLEKKPKRRGRKKAVKKQKVSQPKIEVIPVLKEPLSIEQVSYVFTQEETLPDSTLQIEAEETKAILTQPEKTETKEPEKPKAETIEKIEAEKPKPETEEIKSSETKPESKPEDITPSLTAQDILTKSEKELKDSSISKRETHNLLQDMRIITAILLGKKKNKELSQALQTDKSFTSKQIKDLEEQGLVKREGKGKDVSYEVDTWNVLKFLQSKVVIKWKKEEAKKEGEK